MEQGTLCFEPNHTFDCAVLATAMGIMSSMFVYHYGVGNHIEQLPIVMRTIDPSFLPHDFFTNAASVFGGPRFYFAHLIALLTNLGPLHIVYLCLHAISNVALALTTFFFARDIFGKSNLAGILAAALVMSVDTFGLGGMPTFLFSDMLLPESLARPLVSLAILASFRERYTTGMVLSGIASLIHPLLGLEVGTLLLIILILTEIHVLRDNPSLLLVSARKVSAITLVLAIFMMLWLVPTWSLEKISSQQFISIVAFFRHPHHYVPSSFGFRQYLEAASFLFASGSAWYFWRQLPYTQPKHTPKVLMFFVAVILLCAAGYVFVEIFPSRLWTTAQTFRLLGLLKWLGLILMAGMAAHSWSTANNEWEGGFLIVSALSPLASGAVWLLRLLRSWCKQLVPCLETLFAPVPSLVLVSLVLLRFTSGGYPHLVLFVVYLLLAWTFARWPRRYFYVAVTAGTAVFLLIAVINGYVKFGARFSNSELGGSPGVQIADYARSNTPEDAVFLTPPNFGQFRLLARRAIVVDFKAFPFLDEAMVEWQKRLFNCYGQPKSAGFAAASEMDKNYRIITDEKLRSLQMQYRISYAILYAETSTQLPVLFENQMYKLVRLN